MTDEKKRKAFDPEGSGYDYDTARASGQKADKTGHWGSLDPRTGMVLKGRKHKTWKKTVEAETKLGNTIFKHKGRYYSIPRSQYKKAK